MPRTLRVESRGTRNQRAAVIFLKSALAKGPVTVKEIEKQAKKAGIPEGTLRWAKQYCSVIHYKEKKYQGLSYWQATPQTERAEVPTSEQQRRADRLVFLSQFIDARLSNGESVTIRDLMEDYRKQNPRHSADTPGAALLRQRVKADFRYLLSTSYQSSGDVKFYSDAQHQWHEFLADRPAENDPAAMIEWANRTRRTAEGFARAAQYAVETTEDVCRAQEIEVVKTSGILAING